MTYDEFKLQGLEEFAEFSYFKGEAECPYQSAKPESRWWDFEKNYYDNYKKSGQWKTFSEFLDFWIKEIAAPGSGYDLSEGNWWKKEYEENKPYLINISLESDFTMYKYFKGEANNPFDNEKQNTVYNFWWYESVFEDEFKKKESFEWYAFFSDYGMSDKFMEILSEQDHERPGIDKKKQVFELWLEYLFEYKLYPEYGGENWYKTQYYAHSR